MGTDKRERQKANRQAKLEREAVEHQVEKRQSNTKRFVILGLLLLAGFLLFFFVLRDDGGSSVANEPVVDAPPSAGATLEPGWGCPATDGSAERTTDLIGEAPNCLDPEASYSATITTNFGAMTVDLDAINAPSAVNSFVLLGNYKYYDDTAIFASNTGLGSISGGATIPTVLANQDRASPPWPTPRPRAAGTSARVHSS